MRNITLHFIYGPTASGKSKLAGKLLLQNPKKTLLVSVDSRKVYKDLNIGTNKFAILNFFTKHNLPNKNLIGIDLININKKIDVVKFHHLVVDQILNILNSAVAQHNFDTIVFFGGSALYFQSLLFGIDLIGPTDKKLKNILNSYSTEKLIFIAKKLYLDKYNLLTQSDKHNPYRIIRLLEKNILNNIFCNNKKENKKSILSARRQKTQNHETTPNFDTKQCLYTKQELKQKLQKLTEQNPDFTKIIQYVETLMSKSSTSKIKTQESLKSIIQILEQNNVKTSTSVYLFKPNRSVLYQKIATRVVEMLNLGWIDETKKLLEQIKLCNTFTKDSIPFGLTIMGYKHITKYLLANNCQTPRINWQKLFKLLDKLNKPKALLTLSKDQYDNLHLLSTLIKEHQHYAKLQSTWVNKFEKIIPHKLGSNTQLIIYRREEL